MSWLSAIGLGLLTGLAGGAYAGFVANHSVRWLRISSFEGGAGYWVALMILLGFAGSTIMGVTICRLVGGSALRGFAAALLGVFGVISLLGALAWAQRRVEPQVAGALADVAVEVRFPPGAPRPAAPQPGRYPYVALASGQRGGSTAQLRAAEAVERDGRWYLAAALPLRDTGNERTLSVSWDGETQFFRAPIPARPAALDAGWSPWLEPFLGDLSAPPPERAFSLRYRLVRRPPPPAPAAHVPPPPPAHHSLPEAAAGTEEWLARTTLDVPLETRRRAVAVARERPDFVPLLLARIRSPDHATARDAMYVVGEMRPPPAEAGAAVRERAAEIIALTEAVDPSAEDSRDVLYERVFVLVSGVHAASFGLRRAGVDIRESLRAMAAAAAPREKAPPRAIADDSARIIAFFERLDREGEAANQ